MTLYLSLSKCISFESVLTGLLSTVSCVLSDTKLEVTPDWNESLSLYVILSGMPSTNKSCVVKLFEEEFYRMEKFLNISPPPNEVIDYEEEESNNEANKNVSSANNEKESDSSINKSMNLKYYLILKRLKLNFNSLILF